MSRKEDPREVPETTVYARARLVTHESECARLFGSRWKVKVVSGKVVKVNTRKKNGKNLRYIEADWDVKGQTKRREVYISGVTLQAPVTNSGPADAATNTEVHAESTQEGPRQNERDASVTPVCHTRSLGPDSVVIGTHTAPGPQNETEGPAWKQSHVTRPLNGAVPVRDWSVRGPLGEIINGSDAQRDMEPFQFFMWMFPQVHLRKIVEATNVRLTAKARRTTSRGEILRFFGVLILTTHHEFPDRRFLWSEENEDSLVRPASFGRFMSRNRFEDIVSCICFSGSAAPDPSDRWAEVSGFIDAVNGHREAHVTPSEMICVDESISRWYGLGGDWIDIGLPHYVALDRKPESGCEIKTACCGRSGILVRMELTRCAEETQNLQFESDEQHGTATTLRLVEPWFNTPRIVCADSYFASVRTARALYRRGLRFIGVIKNATRGFPMIELSIMELSRRGEHRSLLLEAGDLSDCSLMAVLWLDRDRRYFVSSTGSTLPGENIHWERYTMVDGKAQLLERNIAIPKVCETYYATCQIVDRHNRCRQQDLKLERKFQTKSWFMRVNTSIFAMICVDSWLLYKGSCGGRDHLTPWRFYDKLAKQLIENSFDSPVRRSSGSSTEEQCGGKAESQPISGIGIHLMPTQRLQKTKDGTVTNALYRGRCDICKGYVKSSQICSECKGRRHTEVYLCAAKTKRNCFERHLAEAHDIGEHDLA